MASWSGGQTGAYRNTQVPQYGNYQPLTGLEQRMNSNDPTQVQGAADEINARNAAKLGGGGATTWWKPGESGGYTQMLNPTDYSGLISAQGMLPDYMRLGTGATGGSSNMLANDIIAKMWK